MTTFLEAYQRALSLSTDAYEKSSILAAIGLVYYSMQDIQTAKSFLFKRYVLSICFKMGAISGKRGLFNETICYIESGSYMRWLCGAYLVFTVQVCLSILDMDH